MIINHHFQNCRGRHGSYTTSNTPNSTNGALHVRKVDSASIANLDKDCFIIPIAYLDRFLPDGVNVRIFRVKLTVLSSFAICIYYIIPSCVLLASHDPEPEQDKRFEHGRSRRPENLPNVPHDDHVGTNRSCFRISFVGPDGQTDCSCVFAAHGNSADQSSFGGHVAGKFRKRR